MTTSFLSLAALAFFFLAYALVFAEDKLHFKKSQSVMVAAGIIWLLIALAFNAEGRGAEAVALLRHNLLEYAELFLFLLSAMSFINALVERRLFEALRAKLLAAKISLRQLFWVTGTVAFFLSPIADNLTTALVMGAVVLAVGAGNKKFIAASCVNIVVAANAGGAFSPFGDITTLMVWQKGMVPFGAFFTLFVPSLVSWLIPAAILTFAIPQGSSAVLHEKTTVRKGGLMLAFLFLLTIFGTVLSHHTLHLPPFLGMMTGLGVLNIYGFFLHRDEKKSIEKNALSFPNASTEKPFDAFEIIQKVEWETLLFFYGIMLCVGGLGALGYLQQLSDALYTGYGPTLANTAIGLLSAIVDNIPLTFAVLTMQPAMDLNGWLLLTLTAGIGGSLLSIGSAAGVALMGSAKGSYTFASHLKWSWAILAGYGAGIVSHLALNGDLLSALIRP